MGYYLGTIRRDINAQDMNRSSHLIFMDYQKLNAGSSEKLNELVHNVHNFSMHEILA